jgi:hypothetical protein
MLTKKDLFLISELVDAKFADFAILMQNEFRAIHEILDTKADKTDIDRLIETKADKTDILRLENKFEGRIEKVEDNMRIVKTTLKLT